MITIVMGAPGRGKSTYLALMARRALKKGRKVYSNFHLLGTYKIDPNFDFGNVIIEDALVIIDEAGQEHNSRDWHRFSKECYLFYSQHRHYGLDIILAVQHWERLDKVIKELVQEVHIVKDTIIPKCIKIKKVGVDVDIIDSKIDEIYYYIHALAGGTRWYYAPPAWKLFDSWERNLNLVERDFHKWGELPTEESIFSKFANKWKALSFRKPEG